MFPESLHDKEKHLLMVLIPPSKSERYTVFSVLNEKEKKKTELCPYLQKTINYKLPSYYSTD